MKGKVLLRLVLAAVIVVSMVEAIGVVSVQAPDSTAASGTPCASDADCKGSQICCPISNTCTNVRGCRKDPL